MVDACKLIGRPTYNSSSMHCTVVSDIMTTGLIKLRSFVSHNDLSGRPISPAVGRQTISDMSNNLFKNSDDQLTLRSLWTPVGPFSVGRSQKRTCQPVEL